MIVKDTIVTFHVSVGVRNYLRLKLSPDPARKTDEWLVDPTSSQVTVNKEAATSTEVFVQLFQAESASIKATYDGEFSDVGVPLEKLTVADITVVAAPAEFPTALPSAGRKEKTFKLESCKGTVGRANKISLVPRSGAVLRVNLATCAVVADDDLVKNATELMKFLISRRDINVIHYKLDGALVKVELETDDG